MSQQLPPLIYIAGPFRGKTPWDVELNVRHAERYAFEVQKLGGMPVIPHANTRWFDGQNPADFWLAGTMRLMDVCDALVLIEGWRESTGASAERARWLATHNNNSARVFDLSHAFCFTARGTELIEPLEVERLARFIAG